jgi:homoserine O-acetyltransferase/O-succinyltransferase
VRTIQIGGAHIVNRILKYFLVASVFTAWPIFAAPPSGKEADATFSNFQFRSGETLTNLRIHYTTLGTPRRNTAGEIDNAVMILHGTGGSGHQFYRPQFADELFGPGQVLDTAKYFVILPDNIGHGQSSKPSDGMRMAFPKYDYDDMVAAQHKLVTETLGIKQLQLILGTSMGCMHAFVWGTTYPGVAKRLAPFACNATEIAGRNRMWRKMSIDAIKADPAWKDGNYTAPPESGLRTARYLSMIAGANPVALQDLYPNRQNAEDFLASNYAARAKDDVDANDQVYQLDSSRTYNPAPLLEKITVPVLWINSADDFINPPGLALAQGMAKRMPRARFILIPESKETKGHGTHTWAKFWKADLAKLMAK